jgi:hypothetical protein
MFFSSRDQEISQWMGKYREILDENLLQCSGPQTGVKVHLPTGLQP